MSKLVTVVLGLLLHFNIFAQINTGENDSAQIFVVVEQMPEFPGGQEAMYRFIGQNTIYPPAAQKAGIEGKVFVQFIVNEDGSVSNPEVKKSAHPLLDAEAIRVVNLFPRFKNGTQQGRAVKVYFVLPFVFKLSAPEPKTKKRKK